VTSGGSARDCSRAIAFRRSRSVSVTRRRASARSAGVLSQMTSKRGNGFIERSWIPLYGQYAHPGQLYGHLNANIHSLSATPTRLRISLQTMPVLPRLVDNKVLRPTQTALALELVDKMDLLRLKAIARLYA
jgi:hypothetical protein